MSVRFFVFFIFNSMIVFDLFQLLCIHIYIFLELFPFSQELQPFTAYRTVSKYGWFI